MLFYTTLCLKWLLSPPVQVSKALPERQLEIEGLLQELEKLQAQLDDLSAWASSTRAKLEQSPEQEPPARVQ